MRTPTRHTPRLDRRSIRRGLGMPACWQSVLAFVTAVGVIVIPPSLPQPLLHLALDEALAKGDKGGSGGGGDKGGSGGGGDKGAAGR